MGETTIDTVRLRDLLLRTFDLGELQDLCFDLGIDFEELPGERRSDKARELVTYCERRGLLDDLLARARALRPAADWDAVHGAAPASSAREAIRELRAFQALLAEGYQTYVRGNEQRGRLYRLIHANHAGEIPAYKGYDDLFYKMADALNDEERELFDIIRANTKVGMYRINTRIREWAERQNAAALTGRATPAVAELDRQLLELKIHLNQWFAKYEEVFLPDPKRTLVYLGDEKAHGAKWPPGLEPAVAAMLAELEGE